MVQFFQHIVDFNDISEGVHKTCLLAQIHSLAWFLEQTGSNLRDSGVAFFISAFKCFL